MFKDFQNFLSEISTEYADCEFEENYVYLSDDNIIGMQLSYFSDNCRILLIEIMKCGMGTVKLYAETDMDYTDKIFDSIENALSELKKYNFEFKELDAQLVK